MMRSLLRRCCESKRECMTYLVMLLWIGIGLLGFYFDTNYNHLAAYFLSLTGFVMSYMFGESFRKSNDSSIFMSGKTSKRELVTYMTILMWTAIGVFGIIKAQDLMALSAYFAALTPFVGAYVIADSVKAENVDDSTEQLNS
jgi:hypothetical protein